MALINKSIASVILLVSSWIYLQTAVTRNSLKTELLKSIKEEVPTRDYELMSRSEIKQLVQHKYRERLKTLEQFCARNPEATKYTVDSTRSFRWYQLEPYNVLACLNPKAGSTTLKFYLWKALATYNTKHLTGEMDYSRRKARSELLECTKEQLEAYRNSNDTLVFATVRHPLSHLVSAYGQFLKSKHAKVYNYFNLSSTDRPLTPSQLIEILLEDPEYAQNLAHFKPYSTNCDLCNSGIQLDAILRMETWDEDMQFLSNALQLKELSSQLKFNSHSINVSDPEQEFFSNVTKANFERIIEFYQNDFEMFGYDPTLYYKYYQTSNY